MNGAVLAARFSLATNRLEYCGPPGADRVLYAAITRGERIREAGEALLQFEALPAYFEAIAKKHGLSPLDERVVEAYWIGNDLLDAFGPSDFGEVLDGLVRQGLPRRIAERLRSALPDHPIPHHTFHVSFVGVGNVTGHVETTLPNMDACRPSWATVRSVDGSMLTLERSPLVLREGRLGLGAPSEVRTEYDPAVLPGLRPGASVALHWGWPALELTTRQREALKRYSNESWEQVRRARGPAPVG